MKKIVSIALASLVMSVMISCNMFETSDNGDLDGFWHIVKIDTLSTGGTLDLSKKYLFWSVQHNLLITDDKEGFYQKYLFRFNHAGDSLTLFEPYEYSRDSGGDVPLKNDSVLTAYGINSLAEAYYVEYLSGSKMVLRSKMLRVCFKKI